MALAGRRMAQEPRHDIPGIKTALFIVATEGSIQAPGALRLIQ